jgi:GAF domain-containing protein
MTSDSSVNKSFNPEKETQALYKNWREGFARPLLIGALIFSSFIIIPALNSAENTFLDVIFIAVYAVAIVVTFIQFSYRVRMGVFLLSFYAIGVGELIRYNILGDSNIFFLAVIVFSTLMFSPKAGMAAIAVSVLTCIAVGVLMINGWTTPFVSNATPAKIDDWISGIGVILMFGVVIILAFQRLEKEFLGARKQVDATLIELQDERDNLEDKVQERTLKLRGVNEISRAITAILNPDELMSRAVRLIGDEFECYYTAIFLIDATEQWIELQEATGDTGKVLRENKHRVDLKGKHLIASAIRTRQIRIALDTGDNPVQFDNPLLPNTHSQIVIPLAVGERVIGALEMQSTKEAAFAQQDADAYQNVANQIAIAFENSRLFKDAQQSLSEMRATQRQYLQGAWSSLASEQNLKYATGNSDSAENETEFSLVLRDQIIGQIRMASNEEWTPEQKNLIEAIASQAALALENARLVEESQSIAARERLASEIITKVWASTTIDSILQTTARELGRALEAAEVEIEVSMDNRYE